MNIKKIREELLMTQQEFADVFNISISSVRKWEKNKHSPRFKTLKIIYTYYENHKNDFLSN